MAYTHTHTRTVCVFLFACKAVCYLCLDGSCVQCVALLLQKLLKSAGKEGKHTVFLLADTQIKEESFLEDVDGLLNAGEVANLFNLEEKTEVLEVS